MSSCAERFQKKWAERFPPGSCVSAQLYYDPHYIGFNNQSFSCHPTGPAILYKSGEFEMHARHQQANGLSQSPTVVNALAMRIKSHRIQYNGLDNSFLADGNLLQLNQFGAALFDDPQHIWACIVRENTYMFYIYTELGARVTVYNARGYNLNVTLTLPRVSAEKAEPSLFGNLTGGHGRIIPATSIFA